LETTAVVGALTGAAGLAVAGFVASRWDRRIAWCAAWFGVSLLPVLALPAITRIALYQEHRAYLAQIGAAWLIGGVVCLLAPVVGRRPRARLAALLLAAGLVAAAVWADGERTWVWGDKVRLWEDALAKYPESAVARNERGRWLLESGRIDDAEREFLAALRTMPNYVYTYLMLGMTYDKRGDAARAVEAYRTALEFRPAFVEARIRLGLAYEVLGRVDEALAEYDLAIRDDPWASPALMFSAAIMADRGRLDEALRRLRRVAPDDPIYQDAQHAIARLTSGGSSLAPSSRRRAS
jgi:tetratricopeptide (TPR) repeat protein